MSKTVSGELLHFVIAEPDPSDRSAGTIYKPGLVCNHKKCKECALARSSLYISTRNSKLQTSNSRLDSQDLRLNSI